MIPEEEKELLEPVEGEEDEEIEDSVYDLELAAALFEKTDGDDDSELDQLVQE